MHTLDDPVADIGNMDSLKGRNLEPTVSGVDPIADFIKGSWAAEEVIDRVNRVCEKLNGLNDDRLLANSHSWTTRTLLA